MTGPEMNGRAMKKIRARSVVATLLASGGLLGGCAGAFEADRSDSPIAARVQSLVDANRQYPQWADFPKASTDTPAPAEIATRVAALGAADARLQGEVAQIEWRLGDPAVFESDVRARLAAVQVSPATQQTEAEIEAWAARLRELGKAPPPIPRRP